MSMPLESESAAGENQMQTQGQMAPDLDEYRCVERIDTGGEGVHRWLAVEADGAPSIVMAPDTKRADDPGYRLRFWAEANKSRRLTGRGTAPVRQVSSARAPVPWVAYDCIPALPLTTVLEAHGGCLPEPVVWNLGLPLAEAVLRAHTHGLVHAGIAPQSVLITRQGALLTGYGLVRAAAAEGTRRESVPGVDDGSVPPEQRAGARPRPPGDVYALAYVLLFARAAHCSRKGAATVPGHMLNRCLAADPAQRPRAEELLQALRDAAPPVDRGLPQEIAAALDGQAARLRETTPTAPARIPQQGGGLDDRELATAHGPSTRPASAPSRRALIVTAASATAGLAMGAAGAGACRRYAPARHERAKQSVPGTAPPPIWRHALPDRDPTTSQLLLLSGRTLLVGHKEGTLGIDVYSGKQLWSRDDVLPSRLLDAGHGDALIASGGDQGEFLLLSARSGRIKWREREYMSTEAPASMAGLLAVAGGVVWFVVEDYSSGSSGEVKMAAVAYSLRKRKELWRTSLPSGFVGTSSPPEGRASGPAVLESELLIANTGTGGGENEFAYIALDRRSGRRKWKREYAGIGKESAGLVLPRSGDLLVASTDDGLRGMTLSSGEERWTVEVEGWANAQAALRRDRLYVADKKLTVSAVDIRTGKVPWRTKHANPKSNSTTLSGMTLSASGRTILQSSLSEIDALDSRDGSVLWRFATAGTGETSGNPGNAVASTVGLVIVDNLRSIYALPVD
ncbi:PQQ-binding-like beta-propeller repeat protein [Streptomyces sp. GKU 257-1]|nr:PQQ-binding-like beta-propeller repeat protein [Streptomyces sp. GKU 257-1]